MPAECAVNREIFAALRGFLESFGYNCIDVPVIEHTDLFLTKSGEDIISKMYSFTFKNRSICLRPEFTASIGRAFVNHLQASSLPLRLYYHGPVFRYEKPQKGRYRQFTQMGVELIGASSPWADAEVLHCACGGLERLGLTDYHVVIGHVGVIVELLRAFGLDRRAVVFLVQNMENLSKDGRGIEYVRARLREVYPPAHPATELSALADSLASGASPLDVNTLKLFSDMSEEESRAFLRDFLAHMEIGEGLGNREPEDIVERLVRKLRQKDLTSRILDALDFLYELNQLAGSPADALPRIRDLLDSYGLKRSALGELEQLIAALDVYDIDWGKVSINLGMGRGLQYYTGTIFEIYHQTVSSENQVCGGGRYDDLIHALGGHREVPACGFSYGLERLRLALGWTGSAVRAEALLIAVEDADRRYAVQVAQELRDRGLRVEVDVRQRGVKGNLQYADKAKIPFCLIVGERERQADSVVIRDMARQQESTIERARLSDWAEHIRSGKPVGLTEI